MLHNYKVIFVIFVATCTFTIILLNWKTKSSTTRTAPGFLFSLNSEFSHDESVTLNNTIFGSREWRQYLPDVDYLLLKIETGDIEFPLRDTNKTTGAAHTELLVSKVSGFETADTFEGYIQARDHQGKDKTYGGDYFRARLMRVTNENGDVSCDGVPVAVEDERNGRYKFKTRIPWSGRSKLIIELMHPSEAIAYLVRETIPSKEQKVSFLGTFPSGHKAHCDVWLRNKDLCNFSEPDNGITLVCIRPTDQSCPKELKWWNLHVFKDRPGFKDDPWLRNGVNYQAKIKGSGLIIHSGMSKKRTSVHLPSCSRYTQMGDETDVNGYFQDNVWHSFNCNNTIKSLAAEAKSCLRNKTLYFIGDSTTRQWHIELVSFLKLRDQTLGDPKISWAVSRTAEDVANNFTMNYRAHGTPLKNPGPPITRPPIVETLNKISDSDGKNVIIVFNIGAHFVLYDPKAFLERLVVVKRAFVNLRKRLPNVKIFIKGAVRNREIKENIPSEWLLYRLDRVLRQYFSEFPYIDTWSMTAVQPQETVHADDTMIRHFVSLFLSHICTS